MFSLPNWLFARAIGRRFTNDKRANVGIIFALTAFPLLFSFGMGLDYVTAARKREKLDALADAAALAATNASMMSQTAQQAQVVATNLFLAQASTIKGVTLSPTNVSVNVTDTSTGATTLRTATVNFRASSPNAFGGLLGMNALGFSGTSTASASTAPNIDFYLMLDSSPSMAIAATTDGINTMVSKTSSQGGCAFACHETNPAGDNLGNPGGEDNYSLARNLKVTLRLDLVNAAAQSLMDNASTMETDFHAQYRMATYSFDANLNNLGTLTSNLTTAKQEASTLQMLTVYQNSWLTSSLNNNDMDTNWDGAITGMSANMPTPGNGTNNPGDSPQEVLLIVTDGVSDESNGGRKMFAEGGATCTAIKNRGIRIAILYTTYNPLPTNSFYNSNIAPFQPNIGTTLQTCASPGLFNSVNTDGDVTSALDLLFDRTVTTAHLTH